MTSRALTDFVKQQVRGQGFERVGIARAAPLERADYLADWLAAGRGGTMTWLAKYFAERTDPRVLMPGARSVIVAALNYHQPRPVADGPPPHGRVAQYAWGRDYHDVLRPKLWTVIDRLRETVDVPFAARPCVDTAPVIEREWAQQAGIGWIGKNTMVLHQELGSYFFLGAIITTLELEPDTPALDHCGTCTRCLTACPTSAFPAPYQMDAQRCISYLTIERRTAIPAALAPQVGDWLFGCDVCQDVCPFNSAAPTTSEPQFAARGHAPALPTSEVVAWTPEAYRERLRGTAVRRAKLDMMKRNARIVQCNATERPASETDRPE